MSAYVLVKGVLYKTPEQLTGKNGRPYWKATLKARDGDATTWWKVIVFSESAGAELMQLADGDSLSAQGALKVETYEKEGQTRVSFTVMTDQILALRQPPKAQKQREAKPDRPSPAHDSWAAPTRSRIDIDLNDDPF